MPSVARILGMALVLVGPTGLAAQAYRPGSVPYGRPAVSSAPSQPAPDAGRSVPSGARYVEKTMPIDRRLPPQAAVRSNVVPAAYEAALPGEAVGKSGRAASLPPGATVSVPLSPPNSRPAPRLSPPHRASSTSADGPGGLPSVVTIGGSLALVLGIFFLVAWGMRRVTPAGMTALPGEVFEVLGRGAMANRQQVHLLRCGRKLLLVCVTPTGAETLTEITDPLEVDRLAGLCRQSRPGSATEAFRQVFQQFAPEDTHSGLLSRVFGGNQDRNGRWIDADATPAGREGLEARDV